MEEKILLVMYDEVKIRYYNNIMPYTEQRLQLCVKDGWTWLMLV